MLLETASILPNIESSPPPFRLADGDFELGGGGEKATVDGQQRPQLLHRGGVRPVGGGVGERSPPHEKCAIPTTLPDHYTPGMTIGAGRL